MLWVVAPHVISALLFWLSPVSATTAAACWLTVLSVQAILLVLFGKGSMIEVAIFTSVLSGVLFVVLRAAPSLVNH
jgi:hypothetical protein